ncbi:(Fe-S)-binding protein [Anaerosphaera multitolerans]|uniref:(Fe-S)-binding protein n=1 Tax=Anaerosphaera multitolerans TaxID=2487351 RepID=A0A437SA69_9FIRM|nr:(Fe-S)-binding protein [Anaerosphaera multitolerans]RVU55698.1 (Fe-S)-binding protein [Anaerosphaera multitolerans]
MKEGRLKSIEISKIDMKNCWFNPGCALCVYKPESANRVLKILNEYFGEVKLHSICCHHNPKLPKGATIINNCAGCDRRFRSLYEGIETISLWEILDSLEDLPLPKYERLTLSVHDSCSYRPKPQVHRAVRSLLNKMGIKVIDSEFSGTKSICCGDNLFGRVPLEKVHEFQKKRASQMPCDEVAVYCVSCIKSMLIGGKEPRYMVDLLLGESTEAQERDLVKYHKTVQDYIDSH